MTEVLQRPEPGTSAKHTRRAKKQSKLSLILTIIGVLILLYPVIATFLENYRNAATVEAYTENLQDFSPEELAAEVAQAREWNIANQGGPILDPWLARVSEDNDAYRSYLEQLNLTEVIGRVSIPSIKSDLPIYHGTSEEVLKKGVGHLYGSALPVGGRGMHSVLTGHTGMTTSTLWDNLDDVKVGDAVYIDAHGERVKYQVRNIDVVLPEETDSLSPQVDKDLLTLITCTPYGVNSHRLLVHAERVPMEDDEGTQVFSQKASLWQPWMLWVLVAVALIVLWLILEWCFKRKRSRNAEQ